MKIERSAENQRLINLSDIGFTLIEFICVLGILSILYCLSLPLGSALQMKNHLIARSNELSTAIRYARNISLFSNRRLALTPSNPSKDWSQGMILFVDNEKHQYEKDKDELLYEWRWSQPGINLSWSGFQSNHYLVFSEDLRHAAISGHFLLTDKNGNHARLVVNRIGRVTFLNK
ncbi:MAG: GspH/FimT family pseudopilin [Legionella sp.]|nr:GspH/FimT family pseudopilin [Legionella sp.]